MVLFLEIWLLGRFVFEFGLNYVVETTHFFCIVIVPFDSCTEPGHNKALFFFQDTATSTCLALLDFRPERTVIELGRLTISQP